MRRLAFGCLLLGLIACGGEDEGGDAVAEEVGGTCVFTPGSYVISYEVVDTTSSCADAEPLADEFFTITSQGNVGSVVDTPSGCIDGPVREDGCFSAFERDCLIETTEGTIDMSMTVQFWFNEGEGQVTLNYRLYFGSTLADACTISQEATIKER